MTKLRGIWRLPKIQLLTLLLILAAVNGWTQPRPELILLRVAAAIAIALLAEWAFYGAVASGFLQSAAISGVLVAMILTPIVDLKIVAFAVVAAIASKKLLAPDGKKHLFNPATFGLAASMLFFGNQLNWWGTASPVIVILGAGFIMFRLKRLALPISYFIVRSLAGMALGQAPAGLEMVLLPNVLFAFVMVVEPKTSPGKRPAQWLFGAFCGAAAAIGYEWLPAWDGDLLGLLMANAAKPALEWAGKRLVPGFERRVEGATT